MNYVDPPRLEGYHYSPSEAKEARDGGKILSIRLETSLACNLRCTYCCNSSGIASQNEMKYDELTNLVDQAKQLGAKSIVVIGGGEPTIYPQFRQLIQYIHAAGLVPVIFTNTQTMTIDLSKFLKANNTSVIIKLDSLDEEIQDRMVGVQGAHRNIMQGIDNLQRAGYGDSTENPGSTKLGASFVVNRQNADGVPGTWRFCREKGMYPNLEMMTPNERAQNLGDELLTAKEWGRLKRKLLAVDQTEFGYTWLPHGPLVGCGCFQCLYNVYVTVHGDARPCSSIHINNPPNVRKSTLAEVIRHPFFARAREIDTHLNGKCGDCSHGDLCMGCRGMAFTDATLRGLAPLDALAAEDPSCDRE